MATLLAKIDPLLVVFFRLHDVASTFLARHLVGTKRTLLILAHLSLLGFFFPELRKDFGEMAANLLIFILFLSPLSKIFRTRLLLQLMGFRRELGIMMAYLATVHGVGYLLDPDWFDFIIGPYLDGDFFGTDPRYFFGLVAYALTLPLLLTSNAWAQRTLGGVRWKQLHRIVYVMFIFAIFHRFTARDMDLVSLIQMGTLIGAYVLAKLLAWRNFLPPLVELNRLVALRYKAYRASILPPAPQPAQSAVAGVPLSPPPGAPVSPLPSMSDER